MPRASSRVPAMRPGLRGVSAFALSAAALGLAAWGAYAYNFSQNRPYHAYVERFSAEHPSFFPGRAQVDLFSGGHRNVVAAAYWVRAVQYVASFFGGGYREHLFALLDSLTDLDPYAGDAYVNGILLLAAKEPGDVSGDAALEGYARQAAALGEKGIRNFCDLAKVRAAGSAKGAAGLAADPATAEPCGKWDMVPYNLGFVTFRSLKRDAEAAGWYRVAAAHAAAPRSAAYMASLLDGKSGDHAKAAMGLLSVAQAQAAKGSACRVDSAAAADLLYREISGPAGAPSEKTLKAFAASRAAGFPGDGDDGGRCSDNFSRAVREAEMAYLAAADAKFSAAKGRHAADGAELLGAGFVSFVPRDPGFPAEVAYRWYPSRGVWDFGRAE